MKRKKAITIVETTLIVFVIATIAVVAMSKFGDSIRNMAEKTTSVTVNQ